jgi:hypothetical protein
MIRISVPPPQMVKVTCSARPRSVRPSGNALSAIAFVPFEAFDARKINHLVYIMEIYVFAIKPVWAFALAGAFLASAPELALGIR